MKNLKSRLWQFPKTKAIEKKGIQEETAWTVPLYYFPDQIRQKLAEGPMLIGIPVDAVRLACLRDSGGIQEMDCQIGGHLLVKFGEFE